MNAPTGLPVPPLERQVSMPISDALALRDMLLQVRKIPDIQKNDAAKKDADRLLDSITASITRAPSDGGSQ